ncbi:MAG: DUF1749 domain-containing protein [Bacteroidetes bacterium]|nr:DUF1749 domain-containing protein [Bacteroidota bacterium]
MPLITDSSYPGAPGYMFNGHLQTILPAIKSPVEVAPFQRERITLPDNDFLDLDWLQNGNDQLAILTHGLEGSTDRNYIKSMSASLTAKNWDILAWNCRSCSGEMNRAFRLYYHGDTEDIHSVVQHALSTGRYKRIILLGFSMGGAIHMKYLGVKGEEAPAEITHAVSISAPCDIKKGVEVLESRSNFLYRKRFFNSLKEKIRIKAERFPDKLDASKLATIQSWRDFDRHFSAPLNGFKDEEEFYYAASSKNFMAGIRRPLLLLNALNDPILSPNCYPKALAKDHKYIHLECPKTGGHIGYTDRRDGKCWADKRVLEFIK